MVSGFFKLRSFFRWVVSHPRLILTVVGAMIFGLGFAQTGLVGSIVGVFIGGISGWALFAVLGAIIGWLSGEIVRLRRKG
jgi:ABC-type sugar transport system permease subunit